MAVHDWVIIILSMILVSCSAIVVAYAVYRVTEGKNYRDAPESDLERHPRHGRGVERIVCLHDGASGRDTHIH